MENMNQRGDGQILVLNWAEIIRIRAGETGSLVIG
jgi:nitrogen regulatory protein PII